MIKNRNKKWTVEDIEKLKELYPDTRNEDIGRIMNISTNSIVSKSANVGLHKSKQHKSNMLGNRNKKIGRDLSFDVVKEIALKYRTRGEFQEKDCSAYQTARRANYLDSICNHMSVVSYSIPQIILRKIMDGLIKSPSNYSTRRVIKPYEIDVYYPKFKLAFEYNGLYWHSEFGNNIKKHYHLNKTKSCAIHGINLVHIFENEWLYKQEIVKSIIKNLLNINLDVVKINGRDCEVREIHEKIKNGSHGIKSGKGFYDHSTGPVSLRTMSTETSDKHDICLERLRSSFYKSLDAVIRQDICSREQIDFIIREYTGAEKGPYEL